MKENQNESNLNEFEDETVPLRPLSSSGVLPLSIIFALVALSVPFFVIMEGFGKVFPGLNNYFGE